MKTKSTLFCIVFAICVSINTTTAQVNVQDSLALVDLYNSTDGVHWVRNTNWLTSNPVSKWYGVLANSRITRLSLNSNSLTGHIPSSIGNLKNLRQLYLIDNQLTGSIPSSLGNLVNLTNLDLGFNQLSGSIPSSIGNLVNLQELDLYFNQLSGSIPSSIGNLVNLRVLFLSNNQLSGSIPSSIGNLVKLIQFSLHNNQLSGNIPSSIGNLAANLQDLDLSNNQLSGSIPPSIGNLVMLSSLDLSNNHLNDSIPTSIGNLSGLSYLLLRNNQLSGPMPSSLSNLTYIDGQVSQNETGHMTIDSNDLTFDGMELIVKTIHQIDYSSQANIPIYQNGEALYVSAGGTLSNNTYQWYNIEQNSSVTINGDSVFHPSQSGHYFAAVTNSICKKLTLHTDTIFYDAALPVTIINLKAQQQKSIIKIDWTSVTEINVADYEIQRSLNALNFSTIGSLTAKGNSVQKVNYTFNDVQPLHGDNYYRIKAVDKDGKIIYSNTVLVKMNDDKIIAVVYPNPAKDILHVETNNSATFSLINQSGKILLTTNINGKGIINVSGIAAGLYYLKNNLTGNVQKVVIAR